MHTTASNPLSVPNAIPAVVHCTIQKKKLSFIKAVRVYQIIIFMFLVKVLRDRIMNVHK